jgi:predicted Fe-S protein YdhL (DUF1289 family)
MMTIPIETPCIKVCILDPQRAHCLGCGRSLDEIADWTGLSHGERADIIADLPRRLLMLRPVASLAQTHGE